jgi:hypothetical protein
MGAKPETIGGGSARGVSDQFSGLLSQALNGGFNTQQYGQSTGMDNFGRANPMKSTMNIGDALGALISGGGTMANNYGALSAQAREKEMGDLQSQFSLGGTGFGTPSAVGQARFAAQFDPQTAMNQSQLQTEGITKALSFLFPSLQQAYGLGTPQAETVMKPSGFTNFMSGLNQVAGVASQFVPFAGGNKSGAGSNAGTSPQGGQLGQASIYNFPGFNSPQDNAGSPFGGYGAGRDSFGNSVGNAQFGGRVNYNPWPTWGQ